MARPPVKSNTSRGGMGVTKFVCDLLQRNEEASKKLTDPEIRAILIEEFGDKAYLRNVSNLRCMYNNGRLNQPSRPKIKSKRYDSEGRLMKKHSHYPTARRK